MMILFTEIPFVCVKLQYESNTEYVDFVFRMNAHVQRLVSHLEMIRIYTIC